MITKSSGCVKAQYFLTRYENVSFSRNAFQEGGEAASPLYVPSDASLVLLLATLWPVPHSRRVAPNIRCTADSSLPTSPGAHISRRVTLLFFRQRRTADSLQGGLSCRILVSVHTTGATFRAASREHHCLQGAPGIRNISLQ
jgi:hypothetical protein